MNSVNILSDIVLAENFDLAAAGQQLTDFTLRAHLDSEEANLETVTVSDISSDEEVSQQLLQVCQTAETKERERQQASRKRKSYWPIFGSGKKPSSSTSVATATTEAAVHLLPSTSATVYPLPSTSAAVHPLSSTSAAVHPLPSTSAAVHPLPSTSAATSTSTCVAAAPWVDSYQRTLEDDISRYTHLYDELEHLGKIRETYNECFVAAELCRNLQEQLDSARARSAASFEKLQRLKRVAELKYKRQFL